MPDRPPEQHPLDRATELVLFLAAHGGYKRVLGTDRVNDPKGLGEHRRNHYGKCDHCSTEARPVDWPCIIRASAIDAKELVKRWRAMGLTVDPQPAVPEQRGEHDGVPRAESPDPDPGADPLVAPAPPTSDDQG